MLMLLFLAADASDQEMMLDNKMFIFLIQK